MADYDKLSSLLTKHGQEHLIKYWDQLTNQERLNLSKEIYDINVEEANELYRRANESLQAVTDKLDDLMKPIPDVCYESVANISNNMLLEYEIIGLAEILAGRVGVLLLAGGQGTRLGSDKPKGMYNVGLPSGKSLFQIQAERILKLQQLADQKAGVIGVSHIRWYIMTSIHTNQQTKQYLEDNKFFGLNSDDVRLFQQGNLPCFDYNGKIILDGKGHVSTAPDGNGGLYAALKCCGILDDFEEHSIVHLHAHSVDNILIKVADPVFIGYCLTKDVDCAVKVVSKSSPNEAVGVVCIVNHKYKVVEYSEITERTAELRKEDGRLVYNAGNICNHYFNAKFLSRVADYDSCLKLHVAKKKIPYVDRDGTRRKPTEPNGIKIEKFIFDVLEYANNFVTLEVERDVEFSALKNADTAGKDCPSTALNDIFKLHRKYLRHAGGVISDDVDVEISPLVSYAGEGLNVKGQLFQITPYHLKSPQEQETINVN